MKSRSIHLVFFCILILSFVLDVTNVYAWYGTPGWDYRKSITIDPAQVSGSSNLTDFPILIDITDSDLQTSAQADGDDILFTSSDGSTKLAHEIELYTTGTGRLVAWVKIPTLDYDNDTVIYMYYGNSGASSQQDVSSTWNSGYHGVWHLPNGSTLTALDSTSNANNGTISSATAVSGKIDGGAGTTGGSYVLMPFPAMAWNGVWTVSLWVQQDNSAGYNAMIDTASGANRIMFDSTGTVSYQGGVFSFVNATTNGVTLGSLHHLVIVNDGGTARTFVDGVLKQNGSATANSVSATNFYFGRDVTGGGSHWQGKYDEIRVSTTNRSTDWITTEYNNQSATSTFYAIGSEEEDAPADVTAPTITSVSSDKTNGSYTVDEVIDIDVTFSEAVTSTGNVTVTLETGATDRTCTFSVSNSTTGTCNYTVQSGDTSSDLTVLSISGTIADQSANAMSDFAPATNLAANKALVVDTTAPSAPGTPDLTSGTDSGVSSADNITSDTSPDFTISCEDGSTVSLKEDATTLGTGSCSSSSVTITSSVLSSGAHTLKALQTDLAGNVSADSSTLSVTIDTTAPTITNVSSDKTNGSYTVGEVIDIDVTFSENVTSTGNITVTLETGATDRTCTFSVSTASSGSCDYTVQTGDTSSDLTTSLIAGTVTDTAGNAMSNFAPATNLAANKAIAIDTTAPTVSVTAPSDLATVSGASVSVTANASDSIGVVGVQFKLDGANLELEDTTSTYGITWDSTTATDGSHTLSAVARDLAGNSTTATNITVTVDNISVPTVTTDAVTSIGETSATLNGEITAINGENATEYGFAYGTDSGLTTVIATSTYGAFSGTGAITSNISSLVCETTYYARAYATNSAGTSVGSIVTLTTTACPAVIASSEGGSSGMSGRRNSVPLSPNLLPTTPTPKPLSAQIFDNNFVQVIQNVLPDFLGGAGETTAVVPTLPPEAPSLPLEEEWNLLSNGFINNFVLANLSKDVIRFTDKFPELARVFSSIGISKVSDLEKLQDVKINLPVVKDSEEIPTEVMLAYGSGSVNIGSSLSITTSGRLEQKIKVVRGQPITLRLKPLAEVESIKGLLTFKGTNEGTAFEMPLNSMTASVVLADESLAENVQKAPVPEEKMLVYSFEYTDPDKNGIYAAKIDPNLVEGEYEIITIINYVDKELGTKELRLTTVIDPEGYIYRKTGEGEEARISEAVVSIYQMINGKETLWDGNKYSQDNPQTTDKTGKYAFLVPEGSYYLMVEADGYGVYKGKVFTIREGEPLHENIELKKVSSWQDFIDWKVGAGFVVLAIMVTHLIDRRRRS